MYFKIPEGHHFAVLQLVAQNIDEARKTAAPQNRAFCPPLGCEIQH